MSDHPGDSGRVQVLENTPTKPSMSGARFWTLVISLAVNDFKLRYFGSVLGYLWSLAKPLMLFGVLYAVFTYFVRFGGDVEHYPVVLLMSIVLWTFFLEATSAAVRSLVDRENLVRKLSFPLPAIPISVTVTAFLNLCLNLVVVFIFAMASGIEPMLSWLELPLLIAFLGTAAVGAALLVSALFVRYRDIEPIWEVVLQILFWGSPIIYPIGFVPESIQPIMAASPISTVLIQVRHAVIDPTAPSAQFVLGGPIYLLVPIGIAIAIILIGATVFKRMAPMVAEEL